VRLAAAALLLAACAARPLREVEALFAEEQAAAPFVVPEDAVTSPARAANGAEAMRRTARRARRFLLHECETHEQELLARALLACAHLIRGETREAEACVAAPGPQIEPGGDRAARLFAAARHAVSACLALEARRDLDAFLRGEIDAAEYLHRHAALADEADPARFAERLFSDPPGDPRGLERVAEGRRALRARLAAQLYDDAAALLVALERTPSPPPPPESWLVAVAAGLLVVHAKQLPDLLPHGIGDAHREWLGRQTASAYLAAERLLRSIAFEDERAPPGAAGASWEARKRALLARLRLARREAMGWIQAR
jgi:hypothetical protein